MNNLMNIINKLLIEAPGDPGSSSVPPGDPGRELSKIGASKQNILTVLQKVISDTEKRIVTYQTEIQNLQQVMSEKVASLEATQSEKLGGIQGSVEKLQTEINDLRTKIATLQETSDKRSRQVESLKKAVLIVLERLKNKGAEHDETILKANNTLQELERVKSDAEEYQHQAAKLQERAEKLASDLGIAQKNTTSIGKRGAKDVKDAWAEVRSIEKDYQEVYSLLQDYAEEIAHWQKAVEELAKLPRVTPAEEPKVDSTFHYGKLNLMEHLKRAEKIDKKRNKK